MVMGLVSGLLLADHSDSESFLEAHLIFLEETGSSLVFSSTESPFGCLNQVGKVKSFPEELENGS